MIERLWNEYWMATLSSSPLLNNKDQIDDQISDIQKKLLGGVQGTSGNQTNS